MGCFAIPRGAKHRRGTLKRAPEKKPERLARPGLVSKLSARAGYQSTRSGYLVLATA
jgi:hypothetical protein